MDYMKFVEHHRATDADITIGCLPVDQERASDFGLMKINEEGQIMVRLLNIHTHSFQCSMERYPPGTFKNKWCSDT